MNQAIDTAAIESLRTFSINYADTNTERQSTNRDNLLNFAHLCTAALAGEEWAVTRLHYFTIPGSCIVDATSAINTAHLLNLIQFTDTTRPDGAIARSFSEA